MSTLLARYLSYPTLSNARKLVAYDRKHPFASMMLDLLGHGLLARARAEVASAASVAK
jgi:hypothetical protein